MKPKRNIQRVALYENCNMKIRLHYYAIKHLIKFPCNKVHNLDEINSRCEIVFM